MPNNKSDENASVEEKITQSAKRKFKFFESQQVSSTAHPPSKKHKTTNENNVIANPSYLVTIPVKVSSDSELSSSGNDSELEKKSEFKFSKTDLEGSSPYYINTKKIAQVEMTDVPADEGADLPAHNSKIEKKLSHLFNQYEKQSFGANGKESIEQAKQRLSLSLGLNRMKSVSSKKNKMLQNAVSTVVETELNVKKFGYFWVPTWVNKKKMRDVSFSEVKAYYKALKKINPKKAKDFLKKHEKNYKDFKTKESESIIPMRDIRDRIRTHQQTKILCKSLRSLNPGGKVYFGVFDDDSVKLRSQNTGLFTHYDEIISSHLQHKKTDLVFASTGYSIREPNNPFLELSVHIDRWVRHYTALFLKEGIYYPEPNIVAMIPDNADTLPESFIDPKDKHYKNGPKESVILRKNILANRGLKPDDSTLFDAEYPLTTATPPRMQRDFKAYVNNAKKITAWNLSDFKTIRGINQTHYNSRDWANYVVNAFTIPSSVNVTINAQTITLSNKKHIRDLLISAISRLYNHYDPIEIASNLTDKEKLSGFQKKLIWLLKKDNYVNYIDENSKNLLPLNISHAKKYHGDLSKVWGYLDSIGSIENLKKIINQLIAINANESPADLLHSAIQVSLKKVADILKHSLSLNFVELSQSLLSDYFGELFYAKNMDVFKLRMFKFERYLLNTMPGLIELVFPNIDEITKLILPDLCDADKSLIQEFLHTISESLIRQLLNKIINAYINLIEDNKLTIKHNCDIEFKEDRSVIFCVFQEILGHVINKYAKEFFDKIKGMKGNSLRETLNALYFNDHLFSYINIDVEYFLRKRYRKYANVVNLSHGFNKAIFKNTLLTKKSDYLKKMQEECSDVYGMKPLHFAAITGNKEIINWLISKKLWYSDVSAQANFNALPLHCGILYCADNGNDCELISLLCTKEIVKNKTTDGQSPLIMALVYLDDPLPVVKVLCEKGALPTKLHKQLYSLVNTATAKELASPLLAAIAYLDNPIELIKELLEQGAPINKEGFLTRTNPHNEEVKEITTWPILEAIACNDKELVEVLLMYKPDLTDIYDDKHRPPLFVAKEEADLEMIELLAKAGADVNESESLEDNCLLHDSISSLYNSPDEALFDFLLDWKNTNLDATDGDNKTPIQVAIDANDAEALRKLIEKGADTDNLSRDETKDIRSMTEYAIYNNSEQSDMSDSSNSSDTNDTNDSSESSDSSGDGLLSFNSESSHENSKDNEDSDKADDDNKLSESTFRHAM